MRFLKIFIAICAILSLSACIKSTQATKQAPLVKEISQTKKLGYFSMLRVAGDVDVVLKSANKTRELILQGDSRDLPEVKSWIENDILVIQAFTSRLGAKRVKATVVAPGLNKIKYKGKGSIIADNYQSRLQELDLNTDGRVKFAGKLAIRKLKLKGNLHMVVKGASAKTLAVEMYGRPRVQLKGMVDLSHLKFKGEGDLSLYWLSSPKLTISGYGKTRVSLAGVAGFIHMDLHDDAELDGRYLRVRKAYVKTFDKALARLQPIQELNAYAAGNSHIYYYSEPAFNASYMADGGAVLDFQPFK